MNNKIVLSLLIASAVGLAGCSQNKGANSSSTNNSSASAPAANKSAPAPASGNAAAPAGGAASADATNQNFTIRNGTGQAINELYVSAVSSNDWEEDVLGRDVLPNGETAQITFARQENQCNWDIRVVFENDQSLEERNVDLCQTATIDIAP